MKYKGYTARTEFDAEAGILYGEIEGVRDVITFEATSVDELRRAFQESVDDYLEMCAGRGEEPDKPYSGRFLVRIDPQLHRELAVRAARQGKSLNAFLAAAMTSLLAEQSEVGEGRAAESAANTVPPGASQIGTYRQQVAAIIAEPNPVSLGWARTRDAAIFRRPTTPTSKTPASNTPALHVA